MCVCVCMCVCMYVCTEFWPFDAAVGDLVIVSIVRRSRLNWIGHVNKMDNKKKHLKHFTTILREVDEVDDQNRRWNCVQTIINKCKIEKLERYVKKQSCVGEVH